MLRAQPLCAGAEHAAVQPLAGGSARTALADLAEEKWRQAQWVAAGVLYRYRFMVQGGMGNPDPLEEPRLFRGWLRDRHGVILNRRNWSREWGWIVQALFKVCDRLDRQALAPIGEVLSQERGERQVA